MRVADFFCGAGGFSEGFRQAGFDLVFAVDKWSPAVDTYRGNQPAINVIQDDVIRISMLPDNEFEEIVPDSEIIIGSPPCQSFSHSNKSGNGDKTEGIKLIEAFLRIVARKKFKQGSNLRYWVLENVPAVQNYIKHEYTATELGLEGNFVLFPYGNSAGEYNAKYFGAPTNRRRFLCGEFPPPVPILDDESVITLRSVLDSLGNPLSKDNDIVTDVNYLDLQMRRQDVTDHHYIYELADFECKTAKRLKQDKGYMGRMAFPENLDKPARTVMATMTASAREAMVLAYGENRYRLPTVREAASMMSFPFDYWFYGKSKGLKHTLVGNAVPPKLSYAIAVAIANAENEHIPSEYIPIYHNQDIAFYNLNGETLEKRIERPRKKNAKFKYHIPYLIINAYRVELTNYHSDFKNERYSWSAEIHYSQGKDKARVFTPNITMRAIPAQYRNSIKDYIQITRKKLPKMSTLQEVYCMTSEMRICQSYFGPFELLDDIKAFISRTITSVEQAQFIDINECPGSLPFAIVAGYVILRRLIKYMGR